MLSGDDGEVADVEDIGDGGDIMFGKALDTTTRETLTKAATLEAITAKADDLRHTPSLSEDTADGELNC